MKIALTLEVVFWMLVLWAIIRQIIVPLWNNERMFPFFHARRDLEVMLRDTKTKINDKAILDQIKEERAKLDSVSVVPESSPKPKVKPTKSSK